MRGGYLTIGRWRRAPVRVHWTVPLAALVFSQGRIVPGFWLGFFLIVLIHELGHAVLVRRFRCAVASIDIHGMGGACFWSGNPTAIQRACIAWGGVLAQGVAFAATLVTIALGGRPETPFAAELVPAFTNINVLMIAINLFPLPPMDGAEAWKLPGLLIRRFRKRRRASLAARRFAYEREMATLERYGDDAPEAVRTAVDEALRRMAEDPKKHLN